MEAQIYIIGPRRLQNELLAGFLENRTGVVCHSIGTPSELPMNPGYFNSPSGIILWDCQDRTLDRCLPEIESNYASLFKQFHMVLINVNPVQKMEDQGLELGVRGFFYSQDPIERLPKVISAVLEGELWVSREMLTKSFLKGDRGDRRIRMRKANPLTTREVEILSLVSAGAKNEEIADELCISPNTVKTHVYNIFKKINVPNRLQAALWAVKHL